MPAARHTSSHTKPQATMTPTPKPSEPISTTDLQKLLNEAPARAWWRNPKLWVPLALLVWVVGGTYYWQVSAQKKAAPVFVTEPVSQGNLTLRIQEEPLVAQPNPFAEGETVVVPRTRAAIEEEPGIGLAEIPSSASLSELIAGLNALGVSPRDMIDILKSIKAAGALHAEFIVR